MVEFLNEQMSPAEVLALEIKQYSSKEHKTLIPRVYGQTSKTQTRKNKTPSRQWDEASFIAELGERNGQEATMIAKRIIDWAISRDLRLWWGKGSQTGTLLPMIDHLGEPYWSFAIATYGKLEIQFQYMRTHPPYNDPDKRLKLLNQINSIPSVNIPQDGIERRPSINLTALSSHEYLETFLKIWDEYIEEIKTTKKNIKN